MLCRCCLVLKPSRGRYTHKYPGPFSVRSALQRVCRGHEGTQKWKSGGDSIGNGRADLGTRYVWSQHRLKG